ncbi:MAG TPA: carotenoid biosynthesis protein [Candidatus Dormibacteraeota bacterium]|nr:carotenoid biosynthesis protein [Candidatus Dormibacteraeota bacterium]
MPRVLFGLVEITMLVLFALSAQFAYRSRGRTGLLELLSAVPFGLLLEQGDIAIFGSYAYNSEFFFRLGSVPLAIALAWAMIITSSMFMSDRLGIPAHWAPFSDAVFAVLLDLSLDAIAIRQGLWHWNIPLSAGFFGVPAGNFYGWLFVAFGFSLWTRRLRAHRSPDPWWPGLQLLVGFPAYVTLLVALLPFIVLQQLFFGGPTGGFPPLLFTLALFGAITVLCLRRSSRRLPVPWRIPLLPRLLIHGYFISAGIVLQIFGHLPILFAVSLTMLLVELSIGRRVTPAVWDDVPRPARSKPYGEEHQHGMDDRPDPQPGGVFNPSYVLPRPWSHGRDRRTGRRQ